MKDKLQLLLVEDDQRLADLICEYLRQQGFIVLHEFRGDTAPDVIMSKQPDLVILDLMLPGLDGIEVCRKCRLLHYAGPILMLTAREDDMDQIVGLEIGADDYVKKPVEPRVLLARVRALLRRTEGRSGDNERQHEVEKLSFGALCIDRESRSVKLNEELIPLTSNEFDLLYLLAKNGGQLLEREYLFKEIRGIPYDGIDRSIDIAISRLRKKLKDNASRPFRIKTVWGQGYLFVKDAWELEAAGDSA